MSTARHGTTDHQLLYDYETALQRLQRIGLNNPDAEFCAMALTLGMTGCYTPAGACDHAREILQRRDAGRGANE